ncbi:MFS transporter [Paenibacillus sp. BC26]|uniref:MFS transporter n=1 Tax=Paenibacillus sp. BC26 TaxID=1881032 RepID=UPI0008EB3CC5|nr:MFS transporter [Paenibacillus sp. BC26]SFT09038.1 MFS transporter, DHA1 family, putative efflux transporter [Paenibacillus sp. BC26]
MNRLNMYLLAFGAFLVATAELVVSGILSVIAADMNISVALAGQLITAYSLAYGIGTPIVIALTSRVARKRMLLISLAVFIIGCSAAFLSSTYAVLLLARAILGLSAGVFCVVALSSVAKIVSADKIGRAMGLLAFAFSGAMVLGVPAGIAIAGEWSWKLIFLLMGIIGLFVLLGLARLLPNIEGDAPAPLRKQFAVLKNTVIVSAMLLSFFSSAGDSVIYTYLTLYFQKILHLQAADISMIMLLFGLFGLIGSRLGGVGIDKWGAVRLLAFALALRTIALSLLPAVHGSLILSLLIFTVWVFGMFVTAPSMNTYFVQLAPQSSNLVLSLNISFIHLGLATGAGVGGALANANGTVLYHPWMAGLLTAMGLVMGLISFAMSKRRAAKLTARSSL